MKNKDLMFHCFCLTLCIIGCVGFYLVGASDSNELASEESTVDIDIIPDPIENESESANKSKMELLEEYQNNQQRKEAEEKAQREFNSLSFFTGSSSNDIEENVAAPDSCPQLTREEQTANLNNIGKSHATNTHSTSINSNIKKTISEEESEPKESIDEKIQRQKREQLRKKKERISKATGFDLTDSQDQIETKVEPTASSETPKKASKNKGYCTMGATESSSNTNSIRAVIHGEQKNITTASQVKLRLLDNVTVSSITIPRNTMVYAKASFSSNRIHLDIESIAYNNNVYPFDAQIYDLDGFEGLYVPNNVINEASKESSSNSVNGTSIGITPAQRTISNVITSTSTAIKNAASNHIKETKVTLPANYKLLIKKKF